MRRAEIAERHGDFRSKIWHRNAGSLRNIAPQARDGFVDRRVLNVRGGKSGIVQGFVYGGNKNPETDVSRTNLSS